MGLRPGGPMRNGPRLRWRGPGWVGWCCSVRWPAETLLSGVILI